MTCNEDYHVEFYGIKSTCRTSDGQRIYSGQTVKAISRMSGAQPSLITFNGTSGFSVEGTHWSNSFADVIILEVIRDIPLWMKLCGPLFFTLWCWTGVCIGPKTTRLEPKND